MMTESFPLIVGQEKKTSYVGVVANPAVLLTSLPRSSPDSATIGISKRRLAG